MSVTALSWAVDSERYRGPQELQPACPGRLFQRCFKGERLEVRSYLLVVTGDSIPVRGNVSRSNGICLRSITPPYCFVSDSNGSSRFISVRSSHGGRFPRKAAPGAPWPSKACDAPAAPRRAIGFEFANVFFASEAGITGSQNDLVDIPPDRNSAISPTLRPAPVPLPRSAPSTVVATDLVFASITRDDDALRRRRG